MAAKRRKKKGAVVRLPVAQEVVSGDVLDRGIEKCDCGWKLPRVQIAGGGAFRMSCPECGECYEINPAITPRLGVAGLLS